MIILSVTGIVAAVFFDDYQSHHYQAQCSSSCAIDLASTVDRGPTHARFSALEISAAAAKPASQLIFLLRLGLPSKDAV